MGINQGGMVTNSFWDTQSSGRSGSSGGMGRSTSRMQTKSNFTSAGWDFVDETANGTEDIWWILEGQDYPRFSWELIEDDPNDEPNDDEPNKVAGPLSESMDTDLIFETGGDADWFSTTINAYFDGDAAQSGNITHDQESWLQTTVSGAGTVSFYWKASSEENYDLLEFYVDGTRQDHISGEKDWQQMTHDITGSTSHTLEWRYFKEGSMSSGDDCGWVDKVEW
ncbi:MAG: hypothetical protein GY774_19105 [Planctomycetes bacterium]|nr:hypothetical protein [Planctomycetota bacterium]